MVPVTRGLNVVAVMVVTAIVSFASPAAAAPVSDHARVSVSRLPLAFEPNVGQAPADVQFVSYTAGQRLWLGLDGARFVPARTPAGTEAAAEAIRIRWLGGSPATTVAGADEQPGKAHYYGGADPSAWRQNVPMYGRVVYRSVYPDVDLVFHGTQRDAEFDFVVHPGGDPRAVRLEVAGADDVALEGGDLVIQRGTTRLRMHKPVVYQDTPAGRVPVSGRFIVRGRQVAFDVGPYDRSRALVIDPVLTYSTYVNGDSQGLAIGVDSALNMVV